MVKGTLLLVTTIGRLIESMFFVFVYYILFLPVIEDLLNFFRASVM